MHGIEGEEEVDVDGGEVSLVAVADGAVVGVSVAGHVVATAAGTGVVVAR